MIRPAAAGRDADLPVGADFVVVGAGIVGTAVAAQLAAAGGEVCLLERSAPAAGSSSSGEGNLLISDKIPGPELDLALRSLALWQQVGGDEANRIELERKGGLVVARDVAELADLFALAGEQAAAGVRVQQLESDELAAVEPHLTRELAGAVFYEEDSQVQPMHAVRHQLERAVAAGCRVVRRAEVVGWQGGRIPAGRGRAAASLKVATTQGAVRAGTAVVNAAGPWAGDVAKRLGSDLPVAPRRGHVLVTEPVPTVTAHKVYEADYVGSIHDTVGGWRCSSVVEATASGTMLLGSSREFVGWTLSPDPAIVAAIAQRAIALFPALQYVRLLRTYVGFRPATPDRLPAIGWDARVAGLLHAAGHEGAGIGLAPATAEAVLCLLDGSEPPVALEGFDPGRFSSATQPTSGAQL